MTDFSLVVRNVKDFEEFEKLNKVLDQEDLFRYVFDEGKYYKKEKEAIYDSWEEQKWLYYEGEMIIVSEKFPDMTFELTCQDKERFWRVYFKDGQTELCIGEITFEKPKQIVWDQLLTF